MVLPSLPQQARFTCKRTGLTVAISSGIQFRRCVASAHPAKTPESSGIRRAKVSIADSWSHAQWCQSHSLSPFTAAGNVSRGWEVLEFLLADSAVLCFIQCSYHDGYMAQGRTPVAIYCSETRSSIRIRLLMRQPVAVLRQVLW